jgi:hypothetical protein
MVVCLVACIDKFRESEVEVLEPHIIKFLEICPKQETGKSLSEAFPRLGWCVTLSSSTFTFRPVMTEPDSDKMIQANLV